jgi:hypothetical protein
LKIAIQIYHLFYIARIFYELLSRDHEDGRATWQPQGVGSEAYLDGTSQGPTPEDAKWKKGERGESAREFRSIWTCGLISKTESW